MKKYLIKILVLNLIFFILISAVTISKAVTVEAYFMPNTNFNIWGDGVQTTYNDAGYSTILKVGNNEYAVKNGTGSGENVTCTTNLSYVSDGAYVKITYTVKNDSTTTKTIGVATHADIQINRDDYAEITNLEGNRGFMMTDGTYSFNFLGRQSYGATDVDTYWFGDYNIREANKWNNSQTYVYGSGGRRGDSGMAFSWQNRTIAPGEELEFSALIGIGTLNTPPTITVTSGVEPVYYPNEYITFSGKVNDADTGDIVSIKYALDGGEERTIGGQYIPNGVPTDYSETMQLPSNLIAGEHYIQVWAIDDQNNMSQAIRFNFTTEVDTTPPSATHTLNPSTWTKGTVNINLSVSDTQTGLKNITLPDSRIETSSNISYEVNANGQYTFKLEDNAGNINNYSVTVSNIDKEEPQTMVNPENCEWSQSINVALNFTDVGSGFKQYKYAITDSKDLPTSWSNYITNNEDTITINEEGRKYLHIIAEDNVGNVSDDKIVGEYLIDKTKPTISIIGDNVTPSVDNLILNIQANDNLSGVKILKLDGNIIFNGNQIFYKNGIHSIEIEDNAGNIYTGTFEINNIYYECNAGLDHPIYSSTYDSCPICESYRGLTVTENTHIYNSEKQGVKYDNPKQAEIIEYYDSIKENPEKVKQYQYELKVIYQGNEYKTGVEGIYNITQKAIDIVDIIADDRIYNGGTTVTLKGGRLVGVCDGDNVSFILPTTGEAENKDVGENRVSMGTITLLGDDSLNYILNQPKYGSIMVNIKQKKLSIINLTAKDKIYDGNTTVEIEGGAFEGLVTGDDVTPTIPQTGEAEYKDVGNWKVAINDIELTGEDAKNYNFIQPTYGEITVNISKKDLRMININGKNRIYNGETTVEIEGGEFDVLEAGDDVTAILPQTGEAENPNVGTWRVEIDNIELTGEDVKNYNFIQPEYGEIMVTISKEMGKLVIGCDSKKYDRIEVEPYIIEKNTTSEVTYKYFISETDEEIERPYDIGTYDVVAYAETDGNYTEVESNRVTFEITKPDAPEINIIGRISKINDKTVRKQDSSDLTEVKYGDTITVQIRVENTGKGSGYAKEIRGKIDDGLEFIEDSKINKENGWIKEGDEIVTTKLSLEEDINNELYPKANNTEESTDNSEENNENQENDEIANDDITENQSNALENSEEITTNEENTTENIVEEIGEDENDINNENIEQEEIDSEEIAEDNEIYQENTDTAILDIILKNRDAIELELKVVKNNKENINLTNLLSVKQQDKRGDEVEYTEDNKEKSESTVEMEYKYADLKISKRILQVMTTDTVTNTVKKYDIYQEPDKIVKLDLPNKSQENTKLDIIYEITVTNEGNYNTTIDEIVDILPQHVSFAKENNEGWEIEQNGTISYKNFDDYLRPTESKSIELQLTYNMDAGGVAEVDNEVFVLASTDLDEILILEDNFKIGQTNNYSESKLMVSIITGGTILIYALTILVGMGIIVAGISLIKKYVL